MKTTLQKLIMKWENEIGSYIPNAPIYKAFIREAKMFLNDEKEQIKNYLINKNAQESVRNYMEKEEAKASIKMFR